MAMRFFRISSRNHKRTKLVPRSPRVARHKPSRQKTEESGDERSWAERLPPHRRLARPAGLTIVSIGMTRHALTAPPPPAASATSCRRLSSLLRSQPTGSRGQRWAIFFAGRYGSPPARLVEASRASAGTKRPAAGRPSPSPTVGVRETVLSLRCRQSGRLTGPAVRAAGWSSVVRHD